MENESLQRRRWHVWLLPRSTEPWTNDSQWHERWLMRRIDGVKLFSSWRRVRAARFLTFLFHHCEDRPQLWGGAQLPVRASRLMRAKVRGATKRNVHTAAFRLSGSPVQRYSSRLLVLSPFCYTSSAKVTHKGQYVSHEKPLVNNLFQLSLRSEIPMNYGLGSRILVHQTSIYCSQYCKTLFLAACINLISGESEKYCTYCTLIQHDIQCINKLVQNHNSQWKHSRTCRLFSSGHATSFL